MESRKANRIFETMVERRVSLEQLVLEIKMELLMQTLRFVDLPPINSTYYDRFFDLIGNPLNDDKKTRTENDCGSCSRHAMKIATTNKGWMYFIFLLMLFFTSLVIMCSGRWWGIILVLAVGFLLVMEIIATSSSRGMTLYSLNLLFHFMLMKVPPLDKKCLNFKVIKVRVTGEQNFKDFVHNVREQLESTLKISNYQSISNWSKSAQRYHGSFESYSRIKHSKKLFHGQVPALLILLILTLTIITTIFGVVYYYGIIIGFFSSSSVAVFVKIVMFLAPSRKDENMSTNDEVECIVNIVRFHRLINNENIVLVVEFDNSRWSREYAINFFKELMVFGTNVFMLNVENSHHRRGLVEDDLFILMHAFNPHFDFCQIFPEPRAEMPSTGKYREICVRCHTRLKKHQRKAPCKCCLLQNLPGNSLAYRRVDPRCFID